MEQQVTTATALNCIKEELDKLQHCVIAFNVDYIQISPLKLAKLIGLVDVGLTANGGIWIRINLHVISGDSPPLEVEWFTFEDDPETIRDYVKQRFSLLNFET